MAVLGRKELPADAFTEKMKNFKNQLMVLNNYLKGKYYLVGDNVTIADVIIAIYLMTPF